ncbi:MAG: sigma-54 interaction domain-containing protein [Bacteroidales bacterium]|jgi:transcriptional regulator with PAS, ATPase and Fis domain|nr:MAG: Nitrogen assimilation regulatory protein [Bacteroidetes bacterium ADurb.Bin090]HOH24364.1 sigma-54 dependent transcriptional regulator [Bacteroidales bacterium]HQB69942.1 sigma-54 dependent transcriptional regulator [Bacteroidales bacterium]HQM92541.1 sigma-54 dependent transcriptional regulator [Bacteroidales bacterium]HQN87604.1 sigma-54 dependent transcriptional regulator [Bacteroidales bacterium]
MAAVDLLKVKQRFGIIGNAAGLNRAIDVAVQVAATDLSVLITGESGVGKESFPQILHQYSHRKHGPYIAVNCGAIPEGTMDSELFGHEKGSFTGALAERKGYFEVADGGTIFLDEVGDLPIPTQARLLRVLESGEFIRVGSSKTQKTNVRIVAATNIDVPRAVQTGRFREDLYYRLNTVPIKIPPLRERGEDVVRLFRKFAADFSEKYRMPPIQLQEDAQQLLQAYRWPGNIRQLKNITEQISIIERQRNISADILEKYLPENSFEKTPAIYRGHQTSSQAGFFNSEREILYQVLFDMKKDMRDLKVLVHDLMQNAGMEEGLTRSKDLIYPTYIDKTTELISKRDDSSSGKNVRAQDMPQIQDAAEYVEESLSLDELEREAIKKALERNGGRRKSAAADLNISERTLYRKIKEYNLD